MPDYQKAYTSIKAVHEKQVSVNNYARCRYISDKALDCFVDAILETEPEKILEAGVGNGRMFLPLANRAGNSAELIGVDISKAMLEQLSAKVEASLYHADLLDGEFFRVNIHDVDVAYTFATLHIISTNWQTALDNLTGCLSKNGRITLGEEINSVFHGSENLYESDDYRLAELNNKFGYNAEIIIDFFLKYHEFREECGFSFSRVNGQILHGDQSPAERYLRSKGFAQKTMHDERLCWLKPHTLKDIINSIKQRTVTTLGSDLPDEERIKIASGLAKFCAENNYNIEKIMEIPSEIQLHVFSK